MNEKKTELFENLPTNIRLKAEKLEKIILQLKEATKALESLEAEKKELVDDISKYTQEKDIDIIMGSKIQVARQYRETVSLKKEFYDEALQNKWAERKYSVTFVTTLRKN